MVRKAYCLATLLFCCGSVAIAQKSKKPVVRTPAAVSQFAEAEKAWLPFWNNFRKAVKERDKNSLKAMISKNFECFEWSECKCEKYPDKRDIFFCETRETARRLDIKFDWWEELDWIFFKPRFGTTKVEQIQEIDGQILRSVEYRNDGYRFAEFVYQQDGQWYFQRVGSGGA